MIGAFDAYVQDEQEKAMWAKYESYLTDLKAACQDGYTTRYEPKSFEDFCHDQQCGVCGDHDCMGGLPCETGDGV